LTVCVLQSAGFRHRCVALFSCRRIEESAFHWCKPKSFWVPPAGEFLDGFPLRRTNDRAALIERIGLRCPLMTVTSWLIRRSLSYFAESGDRLISSRFTDLGSRRCFKCPNSVSVTFERTVRFLSLQNICLTAAPNSFSESRFTRKVFSSSPNRDECVWCMDSIRREFACLPLSGFFGDHWFHICFLHRKAMIESGLALQRIQLRVFSC
jgi:hypothetical protein